MYHGNKSYIIHCTHAVQLHTYLCYCALYLSCVYVCTDQCISYLQVTGLSTLLQLVHWQAHLQTCS